jgi:hypothetical protein
VVTRPMTMNPQIAATTTMLRKPCARRSADTWAPNSPAVRTRAPA